MSIIGEMWEEDTFKRNEELRAFLSKLKERLDKLNNDVYFVVYNIVEEYKEHFRIND